MKRMDVAEKPEVCPSCGSSPVGTIQYGELCPSPKLVREIMEGITIPGGGCGGTHLPKWACRNCGCEFMHVKEKVL